MQEELLAWLKTLFSAAVYAILIVTFGFQVARVEGQSMFTSALVQYQARTHTVTTNARFRWEYRPGSELFVVYSDERDTTDLRFATAGLVRGLKNRALVVKVNRLLRF